MMLLKVTALCVLIVAASAAVLSSPGKRDARCPSVNGQYPVFLRHETKCNMYYECDHGLAILMPCPHHLLFNTDKNVCDEPDHVDCTYKTPAAAPAPVPKVAAFSPGKRDARCPLVNGQYPVFLRHETKCNMYYECDHGLAILMPCPHHLLFNTDKNVCDEPDHVDCSIKTPAAAPAPVTKGQAAPPAVLSSMKKDIRCPIANGRMPVFLPHETKCNQYYVCDTGMAILMPCPHHLVFNTDKNICDQPEQVDCARKAPPAAAPAPALDVLAIPPSVLSSMKKDVRCPVVNGRMPVFLSHETKCNQYYVCDSGLAILMPCPHHLLFNTDKNVCDEPEHVNCASSAPAVVHV